MGRKFGSRNRPRGIEIDVNALREKERTRRVQNVAFPSSEPETTTSVPPQAADKIASDAKEKESILEAAKKIPEIFTAEQVKWFFDVYVAVLCFVYSIALKTDFTALQEELSFSEDQKDQLA